MYQLYLNSESSRGSLAEVWIDKEAKLVKKIYKPNGITIKNRPPVFQDMEEIEGMFGREVQWLTALKSDKVVEIYEHGTLKDEEGFYCIQEYGGPTLLEYYSDGILHTHFPNIKEQIIDLFSFFKEHNVYKYNHAMANMTGLDGKIKAFDFKYTEIREPFERCPCTGKLKRENERYSIDTWISKIDSTLPDVLYKLI